MAWKTSLLFILLGVGVLISSCKNNYERVRTSGNVDLMYDAANRYYENGDYLKAQALYEQIISAFKGRKEGEQLYYKYAYTYFYQEQYILASYYFKNFAETFTSSPKREDAMYMSAFSNYQLSPDYKLDQKYTRDAINQFQLFVNTFPNSDKVSESNKLIDVLRKKLEKKAIYRADLYYDMQLYDAAIQSYNIVLQDFPETNDVESIRYKMAKAEYLYAKNSIYSKRKERYEAAIDYANTFLNKYPNSRYKNEINEYIIKSKEEIKSIIDG